MHGRYLLCLLIAASALQLACGGGAAMPKSTPTSGSAGQLSVTPSNFSFGAVLVGNSKSLNGMLSATNSDVTVSSASWNGQGFALNGISFPATVPAGQGLSFTVTFTPQVAGSSTGNSQDGGSRHRRCAMKLPRSRAGLAQHRPSRSMITGSSLTSRS